MTNKHLNQVLNRLNKPDLKPGYYLSPLTSEVSLLKAWLIYPKITDKCMYRNEPERFYCIKSDSKFVGIVQDAVGDLHWFLKPKYRKRGIMFSALKTVILPHIFTIRNQQRITIDPDWLSEQEFKNSQLLALKLNFEPIGVDPLGAYQYHLKADQMAVKWHLPMIQNKIEDERVLQLQQELQFYFRMIEMIRVEIESYDNSYTIANKLNELVELKISILDHLENLKYY